jgi:hypothetical protein
MAGPAPHAMMPAAARRDAGCRHRRDLLISSSFSYMARNLLLLD